MAFIGSEAVRSGRITRGELRWNYTAVHPDVYIEKGAPRTLAVNTAAAALWVPGGIIAGRAAAALHGAGFVDDDTPVELIGRSRRPRPGVIVRAERITGEETTTLAGLVVSTPARTGLDLARYLPRMQAVAHLDALAAATPAPAASAGPGSGFRCWIRDRNRPASPGCASW
jgi:hypothetical protein